MGKLTKKINLAIVFGGRSAEHEVSVISARNIFEAIDKKKYDITLIGIDRLGQWRFVDGEDLLSEADILDKQKKAGKNNFLAYPYTKEGNFFIKTGTGEKKIDVVFPVLHGTYGEDGSIQGLLKMFNVPFVGPSVLGSAIGMDKDISKRILRDAGIPIAKFVAFDRSEMGEISFAKTKKMLGLPVFVKPANLGSSVGINKVKDEIGFVRAVKEAFAYDDKIIIEENIRGKEIECSIIGNEAPMASIIGEIIPNHDFYSYEAKYLDQNGSRMSIPANISKPIAERIRKMAIKVFKTLCCEGMGRVDFFLTEMGDIFVNEINTIPGFTSVSMYPKLLEKTGISYPNLIDKLIGLAIKRKLREDNLRVAKS